MGEVIAFSPKPDRAPPRRPDGPAGAAAILFFTGVRYERMAEPQPAQETPGPKRPPRRRRA